VPFLLIDQAAGDRDGHASFDCAVRKLQHFLGGHLSAEVAGQVVLPSKLGPVCHPPQHGAFGWHARVTAYRFQGLRLGQSATDDVGQLGRV
jgi:hypothetical protein